MTKISYKALFINLSAFLFSLLLFWVVLFAEIPTSFSRYFHSYSLPIFLLVIILYYLSFSLSGKAGTLAPLVLTMTLVSLSLSYIWSTGFSDNRIIGGLLPYTDGRNYYYGANLLLNGLPLVKAGQATERPLFPSFLATILFFTGQNLKITMGIIAQLVGLGIYISSRQIRQFFGPLAAGIFAVLLYSYIQPFIGYAMSEVLGLLAGCLGFAVLCLASQKHRVLDLFLGGVILLVGISARAGAFFIFPLLALWIGWIFRKDKKYSVKSAAYAFALFIVLYVLVNSIYSRLVGIPPGNSFANFSYAIYGQVHGGTGWHSAIVETGTRDSSVVYRAALTYFLQHPTHILVGFAKSYRDLFQIGGGSIFPMPGDTGWQYLPDLMIWLGMLMLMARGIVHFMKGIRSTLHSLLLAGFIGVFLSIPFLPPVDGGARFHAATVPFFFAPLVVGTLKLPKTDLVRMQWDVNITEELMASRFAATSLLGVVMVVPLLVYNLSKSPVIPTSIECSTNQIPFAIKTHPMSSIYLNLGDPSQCGQDSHVCIENLQTYYPELLTDDFYQYLFDSVQADNNHARLFSAFDLRNGKQYFFYISPDLQRLETNTLISGCAERIKTEHQVIFKVESVASDWSD